jgi:hypothetical protein
LVHRWFVAHNYLQLAVQLVIGSLVYGVGLLWAVLTHRAWTTGGPSAAGGADEVAVPLVGGYQEEA